VELKRPFIIQNEGVLHDLIPTGAVARPAFGSIYRLSSDKELVQVILRHLNLRKGNNVNESDVIYVQHHLDEFEYPDSYPTLASIEYHEEVDTFSVSYLPGGDIVQNGKSYHRFIPAPPEPPVEPEIQISKENYTP
tara:strand:- start:3207 stop:3614 length:408 start_codon:yes stop_codon:yes gene_type:complete